MFLTHPERKGCGVHKRVAAHRQLLPVGRPGNVSEVQRCNTDNFIGKASATVAIRSHTAGLASVLNGQQGTTEHNRLVCVFLATRREKVEVHRRSAPQFFPVGKSKTLPKRPQCFSTAPRRDTNECRVSPHSWWSLSKTHYILPRVFITNK